MGKNFRKRKTSKRKKGREKERKKVHRTKLKRKIGSRIPQTEKVLVERKFAKTQEAGGQLRRGEMKYPAKELLGGR